MRLIRLKHYHTNTQKVSHPLLDDVRPYSEPELQVILENILGGGDRRVLTLALRSSLRNMITRYKANWPQTIPFLDEMVSEGFLALSRFSSEISLDLLAGRGILKVASQRMQDQIETFLNSNQSIASAGMTKQKKKVSEGSEPLYHKTIAEEIPESVHPYDEGDEWKRDILEVLNSIEPIDEIDASLLSSENWGRGYQELADDLGVGVGTIYRRKSKLYKKFLELTR